MPASAHVYQGLHDLILCLDSLGIGLISALGNDQVNQLGGQIDIGRFQRTYQANAQTVKTQDQVVQTLMNMR